MSARPVLIHMKKVKDVLRKVSPLHCFTFAAACAERQWPVYNRASEGKAWERQAVLRSSLDAIWNWLLGKAERPRLAEQCESAVIDADPLKDEDTAAFYVANSFFGLAAIVEKDQPNHCHGSADNNLNDLDAFIYELLGLAVTPENDCIVDNHELMQNEVKRQLDDLNSLNAPLSPALVEGLRARSMRQSILNDYWYNE